MPASQAGSSHPAKTAETCIMAHDLGTSGNKASLFTAEGRALGTAFSEFETDYPRPGWAEQDAEAWWRAVCASSSRLLEQSGVPPERIAAVSFSGMMMGALPVGTEGEPLRPAIIWADQRATEEAEAIIERCGMERVYRVTGHRAAPPYTSAKMLWIKQHQPDIYRRAEVFLQAKDYVAWKLTGVFATDYSDASGTGFFDLHARDWAEGLIEEMGLDAEKLPPARPSTTVIGEVTPEAARATGLSAGTPVVLGGGDGACATVGAGSVRQADAYNCLGSSSWIAVTASEPLYDPRMRTFTFAHLDPNLYFPTGTMQSAGGSFDWLEGLLRPEGREATHAGLADTAGGVTPGASGLLFLPYLMGERSPHWNPLARGAFVGLTMAHGKAEVVRAVLEGVAMNLKTILEAFRAQGLAIESMRMIGGGAQNGVWRQILADVYELPLLVPAETRAATSLGAVIAGGVGVGIFPDFGVAREIVTMEEAEVPQPERSEKYRLLYRLFRDAYGALEPIFEGLAEVD